MANCMTCHKKAPSLDIGNECKTCGMSLMDEGKEFCSRLCRNKYKELKGMTN